MKTEELAEVRMTFLEPSGDLTPALARDVLALVGVDVSEAWAGRWSPVEQMVAYDWAMREYLHASDNPVRRRPRPSFTVEIPDVSQR